MRIACIHIPQFALQCATRLDPSLRGAPVAVVSGPGGDPVRAGGVLHAPIVLACSRAAWAMGVRLGMTATSARGLSPSLTLVSAEPAAERESVRSVADALLAVTPAVDLGGRVGAGGAHLAMYAEVPAKTRGTSFGDRLVEMLEELGFSARVGIADDRFTAWVAAAHSGNEDGSVVSVPRGGSAAFLSPRPLSLLAITAEVQHMLEALGVRTLGEFASLPAPSVAVSRRPFEADYQALARGESGAQLRAYLPEAPIREDIVVSGGTVLQANGGLDGAGAISALARRIALRLAGRGRAAAHLEVGAVAAVPFGTVVPEVIEVPVRIERSVTEAEDLARALAPALDPLSNPAAAGATWRLRVMVSGEALLDGVVTELFAEGSSPLARVATAPRSPSNTNDSIYAREPSRLRDLSGADRTGDAASERSDELAAERLSARETMMGDDDELIGDAAMNPLAVVLSSTGSLFSLSPPSTARAERGDRREAHRRTRRGKSRRARPTGPIQPKLFDLSRSK